MMVPHAKACPDVDVPPHPSIQAKQVIVRRKRMVNEVDNGTLGGVNGPGCQDRASSRIMKP
jgi:hypothetical protein